MTSGLHTLLYHRVRHSHAWRTDFAEDLISATPRLFERQLRYLARYCSPVGADQVSAALSGRHVLPPRAVLVTFDDGYRDFAECAWPLLKQYRIPCVLFVATAFPTDTSRLFWWDALWQLVTRTRQTKLVYAAASVVSLETDAQRTHAYAVLSEWLKTQSPDARRRWLQVHSERLQVKPAMTPGAQVLAWDELRGLARDGLVVAPHGRNHELLDQVDDATLHCEVSGSRDDIAREIGACPPLFAYPNGNFDARAPRVLGQTGYACAFTTVGGRDVLPTSQPFVLRREQARGSLLRLAVKLTPSVGAWRTTSSAKSIRGASQGQRETRQPRR